MRLTTRRILATTISAAVLVGACSSGDDDADSTTTAAPTTTGAPETTAAPETTTTTEAPPTTPAPTTTPTTEPAPTTTEPAPTTTNPPPTTNPGDPDWVAIVKELVDLQHELRAEPDSTRIGEFCVGGESSCESVQGEEIRRLEEEGWRVVGQPEPEVLSARVVQTANDEPASDALWVVVEVVSVRQDQSGATIVDETDAVVFELSNSGDSPTITANFMLTAGGTDSWRVMGISELDTE